MAQRFKSRIVGTAEYKRRQARIKARMPQRPPASQNPLAPRTGAQINREARSAANLQYGPQIQDTRAQLRGARTFANTTIPSLYDAYRQEIAKAGQATQQAYAQAQQDEAARQQALQGSYQQEQAQRGAESQKTAQVTGTP